MPARDTSPMRPAGKREQDLRTLGSSKIVTPRPADRQLRDVRASYEATNGIGKRTRRNGPSSPTPAQAGRLRACRLGLRFVLDPHLR
jgi:hypothetical protein